MAENIVDSILGKLEDDFVKKLLRRSGVSEQVMWVTIELQFIDAFLKDADSKHIVDERQKHWVKEVKYLVYWIEDVVETLLLHIPQKRYGKIEAFNWLLTKNKEPLTLSIFRNSIDKIRERSHEISKSRNNYVITDLDEGIEVEIRQSVQLQTVLPEVGDAMNIISNVQEKLRDAFVTNVPVLRLYGVNDQVEKVSRALRWIEAFLKEVNKKHILGEMQKQLVKDVRDLVYHIQDVLPTFLLAVHQNMPGNMNTFKRWFTDFRILPSVHKFVVNINKIEKRIREIGENIEWYGRINLGGGLAREIRQPVQQIVLPEIEHIEKVMGSVQEKLMDASVVLHQCGVNDQVEKVSHALRRIEALLEEVNKKHIVGERQKQLVKDVGDLVYYIQEVLDTDTFLLVVRQRTSGNINTFKRWFAKYTILPNLVFKINKIEGTIQEIGKNRDRYRLPNLGDGVAREIGQPVKQIIDDIERVTSSVLEKLGDVFVKKLLHQYGVSEKLLKVSHDISWIQAFLKDASIENYNVNYLMIEMGNLVNCTQKVIHTLTMVPQKKPGMMDSLMIHIIILPVVDRLVKEINEIEVKIQEINENIVTHGVTYLGDGVAREIRQPIQQVMLSDVDDIERVRKSILEMLGNVSFKKMLHQYGVSEKVLKVSRELWWIQSSLEDASFENNNINSLIKVMTRDLTHSFQKAIDTFRSVVPQKKSFMTELLKIQLTNIKILPLLYRSVIEINEIEERIQQINENKIRYGVTYLGYGVAGEIRQPVQQIVLPDDDAGIVVLDDDVGEHLQPYNTTVGCSTSYQDLPIVLKSCFMYFAAFPEDYEIDARSLLSMWIAEGFIPNHENIALEEIAESFLEDLVQRSMVEVSERTFDGSIARCRIHSLMRGLAIKKAQDDNFLVVCSKVDDVKNCIQTHRLAINDSLWYTRTREDEKLYGEAITSASSNIRALLSSRLMPNISKLMHLKVLSNAEWTPSVVYEPAKFGRLRQLRYVQLIVEEIRRNDIEKFQKFIGGMKFLQTLDLRNGSICDLPDCVWHVKTLRHVLLPTWPGFTSGPPPSINLINLQSLSGVTNRRSWVERGTPTLPNVKLLEIGPRDRFQWNTIATLLGTSNHLTTLQIIGDDVPLNIIDISKFPFHHHLKNLDLWNEYETYHNKIDLQVGMFPIQLITLRLKYLQFQQDPIPVLEQLENLRFLFLGGSKIQQLSCSAGGFNQLEELELRKLEILEEWKIEEGAMPKLKKLQVSHCPLLRVPHGLQNLGTLQELTWYSRSQFHKISKTMVNEIHKICKHVPSIITPEVC